MCMRILAKDLQQHTCFPTWQQLKHSKKDKYVFNLVDGSGSRPQRQQQAASTKSKTAKVFHHPSSKLSNTSIFWHTLIRYQSFHMDSLWTWPIRTNQSWDETKMSPLCELQRFEQIVRAHLQKQVRRNQSQKLWQLLSTRLPNPKSILNAA